VSVEHGERKPSEVLAQARSYLEEHGISAEYRVESGNVGETILSNCQNDGCDFVILGGYGLTPVLEVVLGSAVDEVLRKAASQCWSAVRYQLNFTPGVGINNPCHAYACFHRPSR